MARTKQKKHRTLMPKRKPKTNKYSPSYAIISEPVLTLSHQGANELGA
jgi:hypothetical protein